MNQSTRIARELVRIARSLVAAGGYHRWYGSDVADVMLAVAGTDFKVYIEEYAERFPNLAPDGRTVFATLDDFYDKVYRNLYAVSHTYRGQEAENGTSMDEDIAQAYDGIRRDAMNISQKTSDMLNWAYRWSRGKGQEYSVLKQTGSGPFGPSSSDHIKQQFNQTEIKALVKAITLSQLTLQNSNARKENAFNEHAGEFATGSTIEATVKITRAAGHAGKAFQATDDATGITFSFNTTSRSMLAQQKLADFMPDGLPAGREASYTCNDLAYGDIVAIQGKVKEANTERKAIALKDVKVTAVVSLQAPKAVADIDRALAGVRKATYDEWLESLLNTPNSILSLSEEYRQKFMANVNEGTYNRNVENTRNELQALTNPGIKSTPPSFHAPSTSPLFVKDGRMFDVGSVNTNGYFYYFASRLAQILK